MGRGPRGRAFQVITNTLAGQGVMHNSVTVTDGIYGNLIDNDVKETITRLGQSHIGVDVESKLEELLRLLRQS
jgi:hypothetical protein